MTECLSSLSKVTISGEIGISTVSAQNFMGIHSIAVEIFHLKERRNINLDLTKPGKHRTTWLSKLITS